MTKLSENTSSKVVFSLYEKQGTMENFIKEAKPRFFFDKTDSPRFVENHTKMMISVLAYNLVKYLKTIVFKKIDSGMTIQTIRLNFLKIVGKIVQTANSLAGS